MYLFVEVGDPLGEVRVLVETQIIHRLLYLGEDLVHHAVTVGARVQAPYLGHANY